MFNNGSFSDPAGDTRPVSEQDIDAVMIEHIRVREWHRGMRRVEERQAQREREFEVWQAALLAAADERDALDAANRDDDGWWLGVLVVGGLLMAALAALKQLMAQGAFTMF